MSMFLDVLLLILICGNCYLAYRNLKLDQEAAAKTKKLVDDMQAKITELETEVKALKGDVKEAVEDKVEEVAEVINKFKEAE